MSTFYKLFVKEIRKETDDSVSIVFDIPDHLKSEFKFIPGQYITIKKILDNVELRRAYSICSSLQSNTLRIGVKAVENGKFSVFATQQLQKGDMLEVSPPEGRFILEPDPKQKKNYLACAAGSGITPILSMISSVLDEESDSKFVLVYSNKTPGKTMFKKELENLQLKYPDNFFVQYTYTQTNETDALYGRIDKSISNYVLNTKFKHLQFDKVFLCGPEPMINELKSHFLNIGFSEESIHFELFTAKAEETSLTENMEGQSSITIILDEEEDIFEMDKSQTVLEAALHKGLDPPYSCQGGICSSCLAQVTEGKAVMDKNTILSDEEVKDGLILTCQAHPVTEKIVVDYDTV